MLDRSGLSSCVERAQARAQSEPKSEHKSEPKIEPKSAPKSEPKIEPKCERKSEHKSEPKIEPKSENEKKDELKLQAFCTEPTSLFCCLHGHGIKEKYPWILIPGVDGGILLPAQKRFEPLPGAGGSFSTEATFLLGHLHGHGRLGPLSGTRGKEC
jgi:hypothetical protein